MPWNFCSYMDFLLNSKHFTKFLSCIPIFALYTDFCSFYWFLLCILIFTKNTNFYLDTSKAYFIKFSYNWWGLISNDVECMVKFEVFFHKIWLVCQKMYTPIKRLNKSKLLKDILFVDKNIHPSQAFTWAKAKTRLI